MYTVPLEDDSPECLHKAMQRVRFDAAIDNLHIDSIILVTEYWETEAAQVRVVMNQTRRPWIRHLLLTAAVGVLLMLVAELMRCVQRVSPVETVFMAAGLVIFGTTIVEYKVKQRRPSSLSKSIWAVPGECHQV